MRDRQREIWLKQKRRWCDDGARDRSDAATSQGMPGTSRNWQRQGKILPEKCGEEHTPAHTPISDFWPPDHTRINSVILSQSVRDHLLEQSGDSHTPPAPCPIVHKKNMQLLICRHWLVLGIELWQELWPPLALPRSHATMWLWGQKGPSEGKAKVSFESAGRTSFLFRILLFCSLRISWIKFDI